MALTAFVHHSEKFSGYLNNNFKKHSNRSSRGVKQAGFFVLVGASMPNVLIELGFISNVEEEKYLSSEEGQEQLAKSIFEGIIAYKNYYDISNDN
jgi:N-acetylmuramoyl-L-alanine amidase